MIRRLLLGTAFVISCMVLIKKSVGQDLEGLGLSNMLRLPFATDLELTDEQNEKLEKAKRDFSRKRQAETNAVNESVRVDPAFDIQIALSNMDKKLLAALNKDIWEVLLPHQQRLIVRQTFWTFVNESRGFSNELSKNYYAEQLKFSGQQKIDLKLEGEKLQKEFAADMEKLREKYRRKLKQEVLTKGQLQTLEKLMGENIVGPYRHIKY